MRRSGRRALWLTGTTCGLIGALAIGLAPPARAESPTAAAATLVAKQKEKAEKDEDDAPAEKRSMLDRMKFWKKKPAQDPFIEGGEHNKAAAKSKKKPSEKETAAKSSKAPAADAKAPKTAARPSRDKADADRPSSKDLAGKSESAAKKTPAAAGTRTASRGDDASAKTAPRTAAARSANEEEEDPAATAPRTARTARSQTSSPDKTTPRSRPAGAATASRGAAPRTAPRTASTQDARSARLNKLLAAAEADQAQAESTATAEAAPHDFAADPFETAVTSTGTSDDVNPFAEQALAESPRTSSRRTARAPAAAADVGDADEESGEGTQGDEHKLQADAWMCHARIALKRDRVEEAHAWAVRAAELEKVQQISYGPHEESPANLLRRIERLLPGSETQNALHTESARESAPQLPPAAPTTARRSSETPDWARGSQSEPIPHEEPATVAPPAPEAAPFARTQPRTATLPIGAWTSQPEANPVAPPSEDVVSSAHYHHDAATEQPAVAHTDALAAATSPWAEGPALSGPSFGPPAETVAEQPVKLMTPSKSDHESEELLPPPENDAAEPPAVSSGDSSRGIILGMSIGILGLIGVIVWQRLTQQHYAPRYGR